MKDTAALAISLHRLSCETRQQLRQYAAAVGLKGSSQSLPPRKYTVGAVSRLRSYAGGWVAPYWSWLQLSRNAAPGVMLRLHAAPHKAQPQAAAASPVANLSWSLGMECCPMCCELRCRQVREVQRSPTARWLYRLTGGLQVLWCCRSCQSCSSGTHCLLHAGSAAAKHTSFACTTHVGLWG